MRYRSWILTLIRSLRVRHLKLGWASAMLVSTGTYAHCRDMMDAVVRLGGYGNLRYVKAEADTCHIYSSLVTIIRRRRPSVIA